MKVNDPNLASLASTGPTRAQETERARPGARPTTTPDKGPVSGDDVHLSELVRSLRSLAADSPERQARIENIALAYANGAYKVDARKTASKVIDDALETK